MAQLQPPESRDDQKMVALARILRAIRGAPTAAEALTLALNHLHQVLDFEVAWVGRYDAVRHRLLTHGSHSPEAIPLVHPRFSLTPGDLLEQVVIQQRPVMVADLQNEPRAGEWGALAQQFALQSAVIYPIKRQETCFGLLVMASPRWGITLSTGELSHLAIVNGGLAEALYQFEAEQQRQQIKRLDQPLLSVLGRLGSLEDLDSQLKEVVHETQRFLAPTRTRVFWLEPKGNYFWQRQAHPITAPQVDHRPLTFSVSEMRSLYQALCHEPLVVVGERQGMLHGVVPDRVMQHIHAQAMMAAPITLGSEVVGFLVTEENRPRLWLEPEKQFLIAMTRLLSLALPVTTYQETQRHSHIEQALATGVIQGIHNERDWRHALQTCFTNLQDHLGIQQFFVLLFNPERRAYDLCFHGQAHRTPGVAPLWPELDDVDWRMLERRTLPVIIDNLSQDLKLMAWRPFLISLEAKAVMACNVAPGHDPEGVVVVSDQTPRQWTVAEQTLMMAVGRQIGVILHQWQLQRQMDQQQDTYAALEWGLQTLHQSLEIGHLEQTTLDYVLQWLQGSLALLITWQPDDLHAQVAQVVCREGYSWHPTQPIATEDALLHWARQVDDLLTLPASELPVATQGWLSAPSNGRLLIKALRTAPHHQITATLVVVSAATPPWSKHQLTIVNLLVNQLAWSRRHLISQAMLTQQRQDLEHLNWYKHHYLEEFHRQLAKLLPELIAAADPAQSTPSLALSIGLRQFQYRLTEAAEVIETERWQLCPRPQSTPLISLLNRLVERITPALESRQLWSKVHNESDRGTLIAGDSTKLDMVLYDVLMAACQRAPVGGRIDLWCRILNLDWIEISITDNGDCDSALLEALKTGSTTKGKIDVLAPSPLDVPPGLHLAICKSLLDQLGGEVNFSRMEDGRILSRLLLPLAHPSSSA